MTKNAIFVEKVTSMLHKIWILRHLKTNNDQSFWFVLGTESSVHATPVVEFEEELKR